MAGTQNNQLVFEIPKAPQEVTLAQGAGLIPKLVDRRTQEAMMGRLRIHDPVIRVWTLEKLFASSSETSVEVLQMAMHVSERSGYLRELLAPILIKAFRFDLVEKLQKLQSDKQQQTQSLRGALLDALMANDYVSQVRLHNMLYLETGEQRHVLEAADIARSRLGWKEAWAPYLRMLFTQAQPTVTTAVALLRMLEREDAKEPFKLVSGLIRSLKGCELAIAYAKAQTMFWDKDYKGAKDFIHKSNVLKATEGKMSLFHNLLAQCEEKQGDFKASAKSYQHQNDTSRKANLKPQQFIEDLKRRAGWPIGQLPPDRHDNYLIMTGFPRSGTTLLENVLASHPQINTCEETSSLIGSVFTAYSSPMKEDPERRKINLRAALHRKLYYDNMKRFIHKPEAKVVVDKTPIIGANIKYMEKIFPAKRYIFSIRHPYDVVLSNWKQDYQQNIAMAAFNDIHDACVLYNHVMTDWFEVFPGETDRVCYMKYDDLVSDFEPQIRKVLAFIGVDWTDEVTNFAENAAKRAVRTPSYTNVRKGLTIGVQTSWQNFDFLFDKKCRELLDPWVRRFDYAK